MEGSCKWNPYANDREESLSIQERLSSQRPVQKEWSHSGCWDVPLGLPPAAGSVACRLWELSLAKGSGLSQGSSSLGKPPSDHWSVWGTGTQSCHLHLGPHWRVSSELPQGPLKLHPSLTLPSIHPTLLPSLPSPENICALIAFRSVSWGLWPSTSYHLASCPLGTVITRFRVPPPHQKGLVEGLGSSRILTEMQVETFHCQDDICGVSPALHNGKQNFSSQGHSNVQSPRTTGLLTPPNGITAKNKNKKDSRKTNPTS